MKSRIKGPKWPEFPLQDILRSVPSSYPPWLGHTRYGFVFFFFLLILLWTFLVSLKLFMNMIFNGCVILRHREYCNNFYQINCFSSPVLTWTKCFDLCPIATSVSNGLFHTLSPFINLYPLLNFHLKCHLHPKAHLSVVILPLEFAEQFWYLSSRLYLDFEV